MTIHKSKGKEFDDVIVYEGRHHGKLLKRDADLRETQQARLSLRVAVTRAKYNATILTPSDDLCRFL